MQSNSNQNTTYSNTTVQTLSQWEKVNVESIKRMMSEKKTTLPSIKKNQPKQSKQKMGKNKQIINTYFNEQHHRIKQTNLCVSEFCLC